jgi:hypothetical protein
LDKQDEINELIYIILEDAHNRIHCEDDVIKLAKLIKEEKERKEVPLYRGQTYG